MEIKQKLEKKHTDKPTETYFLRNKIANQFSEKRERHNKQTNTQTHKHTIYLYACLFCLFYCTLTACTSTDPLTAQQCRRSPRPFFSLSPLFTPQLHLKKTPAGVETSSAHTVAPTEHIHQRLSLNSDLQPPRS